jgi:hypothetical protein
MERVPLRDFTEVEAEMVSRAADELDVLRVELAQLKAELAKLKQAA